MNYLSRISIKGETNTLQTNELDVNGVGGKMLLVWGVIDDGAVYPWNVTANLPKIKPRVCVPAETRNVKPRC